jgi:hypothetical protein
LTNSFVLNITDTEKDLLVCVDDCKKGLGGVVMNREGDLL